MEIVGFNHDDLANGGKAPMTFGMKNLMGNIRAMNASETNEGSFVGSEMYAYLRDTVLQNFPEELRACVKTVNKKTCVGNSSSSIRTDEVQIFLFSVVEANAMSGGGGGSADEGTPYAAFANSSSREKRLSNGSGDSYSWWARSPKIDSSVHFMTISNTSTLGSSAIRTRGVCFGFCV